MNNQVTRKQSIVFKALLLSSTFLILMAVCSGSPAIARDDFDTKLDKAIEKFERKKASEDRKVDREFSTIRTQIKRDRTLSEASRAEMVNRIDQYQRTFNATGKFPNVSETIEMEIDYYQSLNRAYSPIARILEIELKDANRLNDVERAKNLLALKQRLETRLIEYKQIATDDEFIGTLTHEDGYVIPFEVRIETISDSGNFKAFVKNNPGRAGHRRYRVAGTINGSQVEFSMSENLRGDLQTVSVQGIVAGSRLIAQLDQRTAKGKTTKNWIVLRR